MYEVVEHTADIGIRSRAPTLEGAFAEAARGMAAIMADAGGAVPTLEMAFGARGHDLESLLQAFLSELLFLSEDEAAVFTAVEVSIDGDALACTARGVPLSRVARGTEIKAVTFHGLRVSEDADGWLCEVLFDI